MFGNKIIIGAIATVLSLAALVTADNVIALTPKTFDKVSKPRTFFFTLGSLFLQVVDLWLVYQSTFCLCFWADTIASIEFL